MSERSKSKKTRSPTFWTKSSRDPGTGPVGPGGGPPATAVSPPVDWASGGFDEHAATTRRRAASRLNDRRLIFLTPSEVWDGLWSLDSGRASPLRSDTPPRKEDGCRRRAANRAGL